MYLATTRFKRPLICWLITVLGCLFPCYLLAASVFAADVEPVQLTPEQRAWVESQQQRTFSLAFIANYSSDSTFDYRGRSSGFLKALLADMRDQLGLRLKLKEYDSWSKAYRSFTNGQVDLLYGANPTPERQRIMNFTQPLEQIPYVVFAQKDGGVQTIGDLDGLKLGFLADDYVLKPFQKRFARLGFQVQFFYEAETGLEALEAGHIDGFVNIGSRQVRLLYAHPELRVIASFDDLTSDMTLAGLHANAMLVEILDSYLSQRRLAVDQLRQQTSQLYNRLSLGLSKVELDWLDQREELVVGAAEDYLPFEYHQDGRYLGIMGAYLQQISQTFGLKVRVVSAPFAELYQKLLVGDIDLLNVAKTKEREGDVLFSPPLSADRDIIVGLKKQPAVHDVYGLEGKRVAVVDGYWHHEYLRKNLHNPEIIPVPNLVEGLRAVRSGQADYLIENPTVVEYYIHGMGYNDLIERGSVSSDSFIYWGINKQQPELLTVISKLVPQISFKEMKAIGIESVPKLEHEEYRELRAITLVLVGLLLILAVLMFLLFRSWQSTRQARQAAVKANHSKTDFLASMSHEIRTPINGVLGMIELLEGSQPTAKQKEYLDLAKMSGEGLLSTINDILDFSKIESQMMEFDMSDFPLCETVANSLKPLEFRARSKGLKFSLHCADGLPSLVHGDSGHLATVLTNLVANAIKFTTEGWVDISLVLAPEWSDDEGGLYFVIEDTGIGIDADRLATIFDPFVQADSGVNRSFGGTGLGLAISKKLVDQMGGMIWVESEPGQGSRFHLILPFSKVSTAPVLTSNSEPKQKVMLTGMRLLLAEDNPVNQVFAISVLEKLGATVTVANNGEEAIVQASEQPFDAILMDVEMPKVDGFTATRQLREMGSQVPIIALTAHAIKGFRERCLEQGMDDYLAKPFSGDQLGTLLQGIPVLSDKLSTSEIETAADQEEQTAAEVVLDLDQVLQQLGGDLTLRDTMLTMVTEQIDTDLPALRLRVQDGVAEPIAEMAHRLKGSMAAIGAEKARLCCAQLEQLARNQQANQYVEALQELEPLLLLIQQEIVNLEGRESLGNRL